MHIDPLRGYNGLPYAEGGVVLFPVDLNSGREEMRVGDRVLSARTHKHP